VLVLDSRPIAKRHKDILYMHDTIRTFAGAFQELRVLWQAVQTALSRRARARFEAARRAWVVSMKDEIHGARDVARRSGRAAPPTADEILATLQRGFDEIFGRAA
jgi:hypothetical protein